MRSALVPILLADPLPWAQKAEYAWDFLRDRARFGGRYRGVLANTPGWTFTRASTGYYTTTGGVLVPFASGSLRTGDRGALIEGAGTNLCLQSQTFGTTWAPTRSSVSSNAAAAPDGTTTADKLVEDATASNTHYLEIANTVSSGVAHTVSIYAKAGERTQLGYLDNSGGALAVFGLSGAGTVDSSSGGAAASITALASGWYRCVVTFTTATTTITSRWRLYSAGASSYSGDGASGLYLWGAQLEAASFPSSYIPTTTASATRAADSLTVTGVTGLAYPLSLYAEFERASDTGATEGVFVLDSGGGNDEGMLYISSADLTRLWGETSTVNQVDLAVGTAASIGTTYKWAGRLKASDFNAARNGTAGTPQASGTAPDAPTRILFGARSGSSPFYGYLRRAAIYSRALQDSELQSLTS